MTTKILITGATGYLGSGVLSRLIEHPEASKFEITALVRSADKADKLHALGIKTVIGSYKADNLTFLKEAAANADVIFAIADSDTLPPALAILEGIKQNYKVTGIKPILIHTSGCAIVMDDARGMHSDHVTYSDLDVEKLDTLPDTAFHRNVDKPLLDADEEGYVSTYLITPGTIFGQPKGRIVDLNLSNTHSMQIPFFVKLALSRKRGGFIGKGFNVWPAVHVNEVVDLFLILFDTIRSQPDKAGHGKEGYYFAENFHYSTLELTETISNTLVDLGVGSDREPDALSEEELNTLIGPFWPLWATNCYIKAERSRQLGWNPVVGKDAFLEDARKETEFFVKNQ